MTDFYLLVCQAAAKLQAEGKTPSLALIRAHAGRGLDPAALFSAYQQWRTNQPATEPAQQPATTTKTALDCTAAESAKENEINALRHEITQLHSKVDRLISMVEQLSLRLDTTDVRR
jgi:hypothetical protein